MRTLLVDNYDSFTYNLFHYLAEVNRAEPVVVRNDDPDWTAELLPTFDNVVISPGPGTPARDGDFGICADIIRRAAQPLLGVCLGHQGLAHVHGGRVAAAPEPRHGRLSPIVHSQVDVFAGLPSPFHAVRYHSLAVTALPEPLEPIAWTPDGVLMGLRHKRRPQWGVQFHPESICTEHGHRLLENFAELTRRWQARHPRAAVLPPRAGTTARPSRAAAPRPATRSGRRARVRVEALPTQWHDEVVFEALFTSQEHAFWLDSSRPDDGVGRFSIMGCAGGPRSAVASGDVSSGTVTVRRGAETHTVASGFLDWLAGELGSHHVDAPPLPFEFTLGWVGYLGYELKGECGADRAHRSPYPDALMMFADRAVVFDHAASTTYLLALADEDDDADATAWLRQTTARLRELAGRPPADVADRRPGLPVRTRHDRRQYLKLIGVCQEAIAAGETYEVCLTNMLETDGEIDPWRSYLSLRRANPAPFAALLRAGGTWVLSTSPERFLRVGGDRVVESKPIKGTRPRGRTGAEDEQLRAELAGHEKDRSENLMIVDLVRNDLGRTAAIGSVRVAKLFDVESYATVHQLVSTVRASLRPGASAVDCVREAFPGGSMTGAPKIRTMQIIDQLEAGPRGVYSGAIGYFSLSGAADLSIAIRTAVVDGKHLTYGVGGAIVALSDPDAEFEETAVKAAPLLRLLGSEFPERSAHRG